ncbi:MULTISPECIES: energy-coupling factor ABC transporter ATP-binding protein [unclassified Bacillus (in: firmicutes)]|uniref:energy-coupling factor ABC transporter ATP-binding protein n=1 Tax=unclassified Bacillus (in: firmicutes) TaxID=185979 RepID=UPI000BF1186D|nr:MULTISPECIES: energy-coupling factor ABC transporter ATP-binding protein [unclassified Bacillus (in: firmicutes)]PEJ47448.1 energy-coupling factor ABC transporter ATP-binding protein [Bacillus sp. AFS002410]PEL08302.1 energy-coupling factor ABC transporter ATP-binding protein [Bacillus sp. AFS017336]
MQITFEKVGYTYQPKTPFEHRALYDIDVTIPDGSYYAVIGHTGSGKSTFLQHLNGLLQPTEGIAKIDDITLVSNKKNKNLKSLRKKVGLVFQFPEQQLFEETVEKDICFGPMNFGVSEDEAKKRAKDLIEKVGLSEDFLMKSPFELSGGQMRRIAIAGVLAMEPDVLVLDEPTAGLDPSGQKALMDMFYELHKEKGLTIILVTHSMEDAARYADTIHVLQKGTTYLKGSPLEVFSFESELEEIGLQIPLSLKFHQELNQKLGINEKATSLTIEQLADYIASLYNGETT